mmetsp:Transcript_3972/g.9423  ORF Transcript_3972/g.9423 Transcript_3972/m.9423 type:complete len:781 (-) Transcript_3972:186-2528(-)
MSISVVVKWGKETFENVELELDEPVEVFRFQLYSLTNVPPEKQKVMGFKGGLLKDDANFRELGVKQGQRIMLVGTADPTGNAGGSAAVAEPAFEVPIFEEDITAWKEGCSRVFLGESPTVQPQFLCKGQRVCHSCANTCHLPQDLSGVEPSAMVCACANITECLFLPRVVSRGELAKGKLLDLMRQSLTVASQEQVSQMRAAQDARATPEKQQFLAQLQNSRVQVLQYEDAALQAQALALLPPDLQSRAETAAGPTGCVRTEFLRLMLRWFKDSFFRWVNEPPCDGCGGVPKIVGMTAPTAAEARSMAGRVEVYRCESCGTTTRLPRYNHVGKLLETRRGRCGEWVQAFMLFCRATRYDSRMAHDWTDHVWVECFLPLPGSSSGDGVGGRWVHADPCEAALDGPLMYESGWGKKLTYVIATSCEETVDVSKRYTANWQAMLARRTLVPEVWLQEQCEALSRQQQQHLPPARLQILGARRVAELAALEAQLAAETKKLSEAEMLPRQSGSLAWRSGRGEMGCATSGAAAAAEEAQSDKVHALMGNFIDGEMDPPDAPPAGVKAFVAKTFADVEEQIAVVGSAVIAAGSLRLTPNQPSQAGAAWLRSKLPLAKPWRCRFVVQMSGGGGADGMALLLRGGGNDEAIGLDGSGLGYDGIPQSLAIELDTYKSDGNAETAAPHVSVHTMGARPNSAHQRASIAYSDNVCRLNDGNMHAVLVTYDGTRLTVHLDDLGSPLLTVEVDIASQLGGQSLSLGFTASTGGLSQIHAVLACSVDVSEESAL